MSKPYRIRVDQGEALAKKLAKSIRGGEIFALSGELGSGKTTFAKHLGKALGVKQNISSPTFVIMQEYKIPGKLGSENPLFLYHLDVYRAHTKKDIASLGLEQIWKQDNTVTVIEWADKIKGIIPKKAILIDFHPNDKAKE